jgi:hypothetical protein
VAALVQIGGATCAGGKFGSSFFRVEIIEGDPPIIFALFAAAAADEELI